MIGCECLPRKGGGLLEGKRSDSCEERDVERTVVVMMMKMKETVELAILGGIISTSQLFSVVVEKLGLGG